MLSPKFATHRMLRGGDVALIEIKGDSGVNCQSEFGLGGLCRCAISESCHGCVARKGWGMVAYETLRAGFCGRVRRLYSQIVQDVPLDVELCEFDCPKDRCLTSDWTTCQRRLQHVASERARRHQPNTASEAGDES